MLTIILGISLVIQPPYVEAKELPSYSPKLKILEIVDKGSSKLSDLLAGEDFEITTITMKQFVASREEIDGKYDIIAIPEGTYSPNIGENTSDRAAKHATKDILNDITNLKANEIINQFIKKGQPVILEKFSYQKWKENLKPILENIMEVIKISFLIMEKETDKATRHLFTSK